MVPHSRTIQGTLLRSVPAKSLLILVTLDSNNIVECTESWNDCANGALNCTQTGAVPTCSGISGVFLMESTNSEERRKEEGGM